MNNIQFLRSFLFIRCLNLLLTLYHSNKETSLYINHQTITTFHSTYTSHPLPLINQSHTMSFQLMKILFILPVILTKTQITSRLQ